jgi:prepilin-type N-terminal cleavage/methylation domain-containing protein
MGQKGFSLVELLIVVAIIAIIVAIAVPNLLTSRQSAQSAAASGDLRTVNSAEIAYAAGAGNGSFGDFDALGGGTATTNNNYLPRNFATSGTAYIRSGYNGSINLKTNNTGYNLVCAPSAGVSTSALSYFTDESGTIRWNNSTNATNTDKPVGAK